MDYSVRFHDRVAADVSDAYAYYEGQKIGLGEEFLAALRLRTEFLRIAPESAGFSDRQPYRETMIKGFPFIIVYRIYYAKAEVFVVSVHHERKHPARKYR